MSDISKYSDAEKLLFRHFGMEYMLTLTIPPPILYRMAVENAFMLAEDDAWTDALRSCYKCIQNPSIWKIYRLTPEWDALIMDSIGDLI